MVTLLKSRVSGLAGRLGVTRASSVLKPSVLVESAWVNAWPRGPDFDPIIRSMWATSLPSPTSDSPMKKSAAIPASIVALLVKNERIWRNIAQLDEAKSHPTGATWRVSHAVPREAGSSGWAARRGAGP